MRVGESPRREWGNPRRTHRSRRRKGLYGRPNQQVLKQTAWRIRGRMGRRRCWISSRRPWNSELQNSASAALEMGGIGAFRF